MYANAQNVLFSHVWLITVSDISWCHAFGMNAFEEAKSQNLFQHQHTHLNVKRQKCMHG